MCLKGNACTSIVKTEPMNVLRNSALASRGQEEIHGSLPQRHGNSWCRESPAGAQVLILFSLLDSNLAKRMQICAGQVVGKRKRGSERCLHVSCGGSYCGNCSSASWSATPHCSLGTGHGGSSHTMEMSRCYQSDSSTSRWLATILNICRDAGAPRPQTPSCPGCLAPSWRGHLL